MAKDFITERLKNEFGGRESFSRQELFDFYIFFDPELNQNTFRWRIYDLKEKRIISSVSRELFSFTYKPLFKPDLDPTEQRLFNKLSKEFPTLKKCIWSTRLLNDFMLHQPGKFITILEVEKEALEPVLYHLQDINIKNLYLLPEERELEWYVYGGDTAVVIESLVSKAPLQKIKNQTTTTIEKIIVDLFTDKKLFSAYQGSELTNIINTAYTRYQIDFTKLLSYAKRRRKEQDLIEYLSS